MNNRVVLVSCVKSKRSSPAQAQDLYTSSLFQGMRRYAEQHADMWFILSAEHGVLKPEDWVAPYERTLLHMPHQERLAWALKVQATLLRLLPPDACVTMLAGQRYREHLVPFLTRRGFRIDVPMAGLKLGYQLRWLTGTVQR